MMTGIVYRSTGSWYFVRDENGRIWNARIKGVMKIEGITSTNPVAVGDIVDMQEEDLNEGSAVITGIHDRRNYINRQSPRMKNQHHIVAANLDQSLVIATLRVPRTSQGFIDRFVVACEMYHVPAVIVFNKTDLYGEKEMQVLDELCRMYRDTGYTAMHMSVHANEGMEAVGALLQGKTSLISGHSGVGKSTFINALIPGREIRTREVSGWSGKGLHTTTFAEMYDLPSGGRIIDTPGMKEFGLVDVERRELSGYFPEMRSRLQECQFNNCIHINEPGCAVIRAVEAGEIHANRYRSYLNILESLPEKKW